jgi:antitoxin Phd
MNAKLVSAPVSCRTRHANLDHSGRKARFSELLETCLRDGPQMVTQRGVGAAVLVPADEWRRLQAARPSLKDLLMAEHPRVDALVPLRGQARRRTPAGIG